MDPNRGADNMGVQAGETSCLTVDKKLLFDKHVQIICNKGSAKVTALSRMIGVVSGEKQKILVNAFI